VPSADVTGFVTGPQVDAKIGAVVGILPVGMTVAAVLDTLVTKVEYTELKTQVGILQGIFYSGGIPVKIEDDSVTNKKIVDGAVNAAKIEKYSITNDQISFDAGIAYSKLASASKMGLLGNDEGNGPIELLSVAKVKNLLGIAESGSPSNIANGSIDDGHIKSGANIDVTKLNRGSYSNRVLGINGTGTPTIGWYEIVDDMIKDGTISFKKLALSGGQDGDVLTATGTGVVWKEGAVTAAKIQNGTTKGLVIVSGDTSPSWGTVGTEGITNGAVTNDKIQSVAVGKITGSNGSGCGDGFYWVNLE